MKIPFHRCDLAATLTSSSPVCEGHRAPFSEPNSKVHPDREPCAAKGDTLKFTATLNHNRDNSSEPAWELPPNYSSGPYPDYSSWPYPNTVHTVVHMSYSLNS